MKSAAPRRLAPAFFLAAFTALASVQTAGCGARTTVFAAPYSAPELEIQVKQIRFDDGKLELKLIFVNRTPHVMVVDRNQIRLRVGGQLLTRFTGRFGGLTSPTHTIPPALSHAVHCDYMVGEGFAGRAALALSQGGVIVNGAHVPVPDFELSIESDE